MVPQPSLPPQSEAIPMTIPILVPTTPPSPPITSTIIVAGGRRKKKEPIAPLPPRVQLPCALCERKGHPTHKCPSLPELHSFIQLPQEHLFLTTPPRTSHTTMIINHMQTTYTNQFCMCHMCRIWALHSSFPIYPIRLPHISHGTPHISS
jgi:hypothetical protein